MSITSPSNGAIGQTATITDGMSGNNQIWHSRQKGAIIWLHSDKNTGFTPFGTFPAINKELNVQSTDFDITYDNLQSWSYNGRKISKIVYNVHAYQNKLPNHINSNGDDTLNSWNVALIEVGSDPTRGLELQGVNADIDIKFYYDDGSQVNFSGNNAYFAVGSLNNYQNQYYSFDKDGNKDAREGFSIEYTNVVSGGTAVGLIGSSVTPHDNDLYSTNPNTTHFGDNDTVSSWEDDGKGSVKRTPGFPDAPSMSWDTVGNPNQYYGAGLIRLNGNELKLQVGERFDNIPADAVARNYQWWNMSTLIPETQPQELHYHYNTTNVYANRIIFSIILLSSLTCNSLITCKYVF